ncbi:uncharacterized protein [Blastocystis hominis]|uniref:SHSP domain-containing protein n=1 Tax=Blastocystis hominis TaxID=12968 RepID=D8LYZ5_BLAHO|nr:uncharacterized protein [Blastocystis hominis]CBK21034.2 unnamed protein product [Blastocystis hominis]|eukprot:XP_012895082.1 uncharacterized protein [Blastocystis hominis]
MICIEGKRKKKVIGPNDKYLQTERRNGPFKRALKMPATCDTEKIAAKLEDGMLILTMPKVEAQQAAVVKI